MPTAASRGRTIAAALLVVALAGACADAARTTHRAADPVQTSQHPAAQANAATAADHHAAARGTHGYPHSGPNPPLHSAPPPRHRGTPEPPQKWIATVVLDPGHNGGNVSHLSEINRLVPAGYGRRKPCNTVGTSTNAGYPEHAYTWDVANRVKRLLEARHVRVIMTRYSDAGVGPCVNVRARIESERGVAAAIAIHGDGAPAGDHGFHLCVDSRRPVGATRATVDRTRRLDAALHRALAQQSPISIANYVGGSGYYYRDDLAGLNLSTNPTAFLEIGNMRNAHDAAIQSSASGRQQIARAVAIGILAYVKRS